jgi:hypothetical protein
VSGDVNRLASLALILGVLAAQGIGLCAGWQATAEARMACCTSGGACPMKKSAARRAPSNAVVSQASADSCCAASEESGAPAPSPAFVPIVSLGPVVSPIAVLAPRPPSPRREAWHAVAPLPGSQVPKHLLLSVFLI